MIYMLYVDYGIDWTKAKTFEVIFRVSENTRSEWKADSGDDDIFDDGEHKDYDNVITDPCFYGDLRIYSKNASDYFTKRAEKEYYGVND